MLENKQGSTIVEAIWHRCTTFKWCKK